MVSSSGVFVTRTCCLRMLTQSPVFDQRFCGATACSVSFNGSSLKNTTKSKKEKLIVISGPTGAGKSRLATELAKRRNGEIITADSVEVDKERPLPSKSPTVDMERLVSFLYEDLPHLFDDQGIDRTAYDERVKFRDPITKHDTIGGYLFNIDLLKVLFRPDFDLHWVKQTGPYEITTRWTMVMKFLLLPWKPELVFTGTSVMAVNPETGKFCSHLDFWDSIKNNDYFSLEGLFVVLKQLRPYKTPDLETPKYRILRRMADYEVRQYEPFIVVETNGDKLSGSSGFNNVAGYIFGKNATAEKIRMTTPVFTQATNPELSSVAVQIVIPSEKDLSSLPAPSEENIKLKQLEGGFAAALKFSGKPTEDVVRVKERELRNSLIRDGLRPKTGCMLARYNDPGRTWNFIMRNEVIIWLEEFNLD